MSNDTKAQAPTIRNAGTTPARPRKLFVNIPVANLQRSIVFFEDLGFTFYKQFTDATGTCMLVGQDAYFMLLDTERFKGFSGRPIGDRSRETNALFSLALESRDQVNQFVERAIAAGGSYAMGQQDHVFMYGWSFRDPDGHHWEVFWMDPAIVQE